MGFPPSLLLDYLGDSGAGAGSLRRAASGGLRCGGEAAVQEQPRDPGGHGRVSYTWGGVEEEAERRKRERFGWLLGFILMLRGDGAGWSFSLGKLIL